LEAMACGNAIIATDVGNTRLFINDNNGILVDFNPERISNALEYLINNAELCKAKGRYAAEYVKNNFKVQKAIGYYANLVFKANHFEK